MTKWWNDDSDLEQNLFDWFSHEDLSSWLPCSYEIFVGSPEVKEISFWLENGEASWSVHYTDYWCFPAGTTACKTVEDIIVGFKSIMKDPTRYRKGEWHD